MSTVDPRQHLGGKTGAGEIDADQVDTRLHGRGEGEGQKRGTEQARPGNGESGGSGSHEITDGNGKTKRNRFIPRDEDSRSGGLGPRLDSMSFR
ncbi:hypothetical protein thsps117_15270 [Pseudomonas sp. No.117]